MSSEARFSDQGVEVLVELGMPREIALSVRNSEGFTPRMTVITGMFTLVVLLAMIALAVWTICVAPISKLFMLLGIIPTDTLLIDVERSFAVVSIFVAICATGVVTNLMASCSRQLAIRTGLTSIQKYMTQSPAWSHRFFPGGAIRRIDPELSRDDYLAAWPWADAWLATRAFWGSALLMCLCIVWDGNSATCATPEGILVGSRFTLSRQIVPWEDVQMLSTGCYRSGNGTVRNQIWRIQLPSGVSVDFNDSPSLDDTGSNLDALLEVDGLLRENRVPWQPARFEGGPFEGQLQWDEDCFTAIQHELGDEARGKFRRVYRLDEAQP